MVPMNDARRKPQAPMRAALLAGAIASVAAALVSLPLRSPHDGLLNTGSVTTGSLVLALASGYLWRALSERARAPLLFAAAMGAGFLAWVGVAFAAETQLARMVSFTAPLAAIVFGGVALLTPMLAPIASRRWVALAAVAVAVAVGAAFAGNGDAASGRLELPPRAGMDISPSTPATDAVHPLRDVADAGGRPAYA